MINPFESIIEATRTSEESQGKLSSFFVIVSLLNDAYDETETDYNGGNPWRWLFDHALKDYEDCQIVREFRARFNTEYERAL
jgi:hypothetical protein